jgi:hypothetical protein
VGRRVHPEIIEVISPGAQDGRTRPGPAWAPASASGATGADPSRPGQPRWIVPAAVAAVLAIVIVLAVTAGGGGHESPRTAPATAVTSTSTTTSVASIGPPTALKVVPDTPAGFTPMYAQQVYPHRNSSEYDGPDRQLWTNGPSVRNSAWFEIEAYPAGDPNAPSGYFTGDRRLVTPAGIVVIGSDDTGVYRNASGPIIGGSASITAQGVDDNTLIGVMQAIFFTDHLAADSLSAVAPGFRQIAAARPTARPDLSHFDDAGIIVSYVSGDRTSDIAVVVNPYATDYDARAAAFFAQTTTVTLDDGTPATLTTDERDGADGHVLSLQRFGLTIQIAGRVPIDLLRRVAATLHIAGTAEWTALADSGANVNGTNENQPSPAMHHVDIGGGDLRGGSTWALSADVQGRQISTVGVAPPQLDLVVKNDRSESDGYPTLRSSVPGIQIVATDQMTAVVGQADQAGATLEVTVNGQVSSTPLDVQLTASTPASLIGAFGFAEVVPFSARIVAADGTVLASASG